MTNFEIYIFALATFIFCFFRTKYLMLFFQQDEYRSNWFFKYILRRAVLIDKKLTIFLLLIWVATLYIPLTIWAIIPLFILFVVDEDKFLKLAKKKLVITNRVKRIMSVNMALVATILLFLVLKTPLASPAIIALILVQAMPFSLILANTILSPYEKNVQNKFKNEAIEKIKKLKPIVIGITGSYGKTSTKHILAHILAGNLPVLFTPGSVNTEMGVTRIIREKLTEEHKFFVVEMGAYFKGSIKKLCDLTNPKHGIITSIGQAHYEHFKTQETIASAKFELGECVQQNKGILIVNTDQIESKFLPKKMDMIKVGSGNDIHVSDIKETAEGLSFVFHTEDGKSHKVSAPVYGTHQVYNISLCIEMALKLGMSMKTIITTLKTLPQTKHRLEVLHRENGAIVIDDAYNSNITGFKSGLDLLQILNKKRKILLTPGMVELGVKHNEMHYDIGKYAGKKVDVAVVVRIDRIPTFKKGFLESASKNTSLIEAESFKEAQSWLEKNLQPDDVVLLENDLTDIYESKKSL